MFRKENAQICLIQDVLEESESAIQKPVRTCTGESGVQGAARLNRKGGFWRCLQRFSRIGPVGGREEGGGVFHDLYLGAWLHGDATAIY